MNMKALVMTAIFAATSLVTSVANELNNKYVYNYAVDDNNQVTSEMVYKADGKYLEHHLKYDYTYDEAGRVVRKEAYKWNATEQAYERYYCMTYTYAQEGVSLEYALWNEKAGDYTTGKQRAVYNLTFDGVNYQAYEWDGQQNQWQLQAEHAVTSDANLFAVR